MTLLHLFRILTRRMKLNPVFIRTKNNSRK
jgi:hypothetical protein